MRDWRLWGILVIALAARVALLTPASRTVTDPNFPLPPDTKEYLGLALGLYPLPDRLGDFARSSGPEILRTPAYPAFIAAGLGLGFAQESSPLTFFAVQVFIDLHLVFLTFLLGRAVLSHRAGLLAALFQAVSPIAVAAPCRILSDSLFAFMLTGAVLLFVRHLKTAGWWSLLASAAVLGVACYVRPIGLPMAAVFVVALLVKHTRFLRRVANAVAFAGVVTLLIAPWVARNIVVADFYGFSSVQAEGMYYYTAAETLAVKEGKSVEEVREELRLKADDICMPTCSHMAGTPGARARYMQARAWEIFCDDPGTFLWVHLKGCMAFWLPGATEVLEVAGATTGQKGTLEVLHREGLLAAVRHYFGDDTRAMLAAAGLSAIDAVRYLGIVLLGAAWVRRRMRKGQDARDARDKSCASEETIPCIPCILLPVLILFVGLVLVSFLLPGPASHPRFRVPVEPLLSIAAAAGWVATIRRSQDARDARDNRRENQQ